MSTTSSGGARFRRGVSADGPGDSSCLGNWTSNDMMISLYYHVHSLTSSATVKGLGEVDVGCFREFSASPENSDFSAPPADTLRHELSESTRSVVSLENSSKIGLSFSVTKLGLQRRRRTPPLHFRHLNDVHVDHSISLRGQESNSIEGTRTRTSEIHFCRFRDFGLNLFLWPACVSSIKYGVRKNFFEFVS